MRAFLNLRYTVPQRRMIYAAGLKRLGYEVHHGMPFDTRAGDVLVTWNRLSQLDGVAKKFERMGLPVLVTENASWGNGFCGERWYTMARNRHNTRGCFDVGGPERWDDLAVDLPEFRTEGETVILPQRGIGTPPVAMPKTWPRKALQKHGGRIRRHPGKRPSKPLEDDLSDCGKVVTWGSGAAIKALLMGIPVVSDMPQWIGEQDNTEQGRLEMFRRLAWAQWRLSEIESGEAFARLL